MFDAKYQDWNQKRVKGIIGQYGHQFMFQKKVLDLGCGYGDIGGALYRLGANITAVDARQEHLNIVSKKFPGIKTIKLDLDREWTFKNNEFDLILDLGLLCHLTNYEKHLKEVVYSTTYLILETSVLDTPDPNRTSQMQENKGIYDLSINGMGCRPSAAAIERVLKNCGMIYQRVDHNKFNSGSFTYDWQPRNDASTDIHRRRIWFCEKKEITSYAMPQIVNSLGQLQNSQTPVKLKSPPPIQQVSVVAKNGIAIVNDKTPFNIDYTSGYSSDVDVVREASQTFSLIKKEEWQAPIQFELTGTILPTTYSSNMWFKKVANFFPHLKPHKRALNLLEYDRVNGKIDLLMCAIHHLGINDKIWIDEWWNQELNDDDLNNLRQCRTIFTPSLINAQEILRKLPDANVVRVHKPWMNIYGINSQFVPCISEKYYIYFEKNLGITRNLYASWDQGRGKLVVVGARGRLPSWAIYVSDAENYETINKWLVGASGVIDITNNTYYMSGIQQLALGLGVPIITNNNQLDNPNVIVIGGLNGEVLKKSMDKLPMKKNPNLEYNNQMNEIMKKMMGQ